MVARAVLVSLLVGTAALPATTSQAHSPAKPKRPGTCTRTFTVAQAKRAAREVYRGTGRVTRRQRRRLSWMASCQRNPAAQGYVRGYEKRQRKAWLARRNPFHSAYVSYYNDSGGHCCGVYAHYGVADCGTGGGPCYPQGTKVEFCLHGCVVATVDDHGPYVAGREWDLNQNTAAAIGFSGLGYVKWRLSK